MLVLNRKDGQWIEVRHRGGDVLRIRVYRFERDEAGRPQCRLAFDDDARNFDITRPDALSRPRYEGVPAEAPAA